jgi:hypothetical protein
VLADGEVVGRIFKANAAPVGSPWMWTLAFGYHRERAANHGYAATRPPWLRSARAGGANDPFLDEVRAPASRSDNSDMKIREGATMT